MDPVTSRNRFLSAQDISDILGVTVRYAQDLMYEMPCINIGRGKKPLLRVAENDFDEWIHSKKTNGTTDSSPVFVSHKSGQKKMPAQQTATPWESSVRIPKRK